MPIDPGIIQASISAIGGIIAGFAGGKTYQGRKSDTKCEKVCSIMLNGFDKLLTALEVAGEPPEIKSAIRDARDAIVIAKSHLGYIGGGENPPHQ